METLLRKLRLDRGLSASDLAREANMHGPNWYRLEAGREKAGPAVRGRVAAALGQLESDLFDAQGWPLPAEVAP